MSFLDNLGKIFIKKTINKHICKDEKCHKEVWEATNKVFEKMDRVFDEMGEVFRKI